jgi:N-methylhydantoinase A
MRFRIGADIGGTFTDLVLLSDDGKTFALGKILTTPNSPDDAVVNGVAELLMRSGVNSADAAHTIHGTTLFTNALIERKGAKTALVTTRGFRDAIEIAREHRYDMYDLRIERPAPLAPRQLRFELDERILADGTVRRSLDEHEVRALAETLKANGIEAVAICLINAYRNAAHEVSAARIMAEELHDAALTYSSELVPEIREYERTSTTLANVYVKGIARAYLERLGRRLQDENGLGGTLLFMQSNGGVCELDTAQRFPIRLVESGPAAGAIAAAYYGRLLGRENLLSFDMGGTTAKACVIADGEPLIAPDFEVDRRYQFKKGSGFPIKVPAIEMIEIGTGGGSIAAVDAMRRLSVGPRSAGADPGPCCYGLGGVAPTVTDADLVLGYLDPEFFLGGRMKLDRARAAGAIEAEVGEKLGLGLADAAWGIHQLANESMASAARIHTIERGKDVQKFPLFAFGGAGPVHALGVARILRSPEVIYPLGAGVISALGFLAAPLAFDFVRSFPSALHECDWPAVRQIIADMEAEGRSILGRSIPTELVHFRRYADMRYRKQGYEIRVPVPDGELDATQVGNLRREFERAYVALYGHIIPRAQIDIVSWRVIALGPAPDLVLPRATQALPRSPIKGQRRIYLPSIRDYDEAPVYDRYSLTAGQEFSGPAVIEEREATVIVNGPAAVRVDEWGNLFVRAQQETVA